MKKLLKWGGAAALLLGLFIAPLVALAIYNPSPRAALQRGWAMMNEIGNFETLFLTVDNRIEKRNAAGVTVAELDTYDLVIHIPDIGTAGTHFIVAPSTGVIISAYATVDGTLATSATNLRLLTNIAQGFLPANMTPAEAGTTGTQAARTTQANQLYVDTQASGFLLTLTSTQALGTATREADFVHQPVNLGTVIGIDTDGGTTTTTVARVTLRIQMLH